jgi:hypothetical protein
MVAFMGFLRYHDIARDGGGESGEMRDGEIERKETDGKAKSFP